MVICSSDCVVSESQRGRHDFQLPVDNTQPAPALTLVGCAGSDNIPFPVFMNRSQEDDSLEGWAHFQSLVSQMTADHPWQSRKSRVVWRGGTQGKSCWDGKPGRPPSVFRNTSALTCGRRGLRYRAAKSSKSKQLFDLDYNFLDFDQQMGYRGCIYVEGHCGWADRGRHLMISDSVILWQETMCREWYELYVSSSSFLFLFRFLSFTSSPFFRPLPSSHSHSLRFFTFGTLASIQVYARS